jgi:hypothetical protein
MTTYIVVSSVVQFYMALKGIFIKIVRLSQAHFCIIIFTYWMTNIGVLSMLTFCNYDQFFLLLMWKVAWG